MKHKVLTLIIFSSLLLVGVFGTAQAQTEEEGQEYIVQADDWLSKIADKFYGDILAYPTIVDATNARAADDDSFTVIDNPDIIEIGQKLWIPNASTEGMMTEEVPSDDGAMATEEMAEGVEATGPTSYDLPGEEVFPEGVAYNSASGKFYVGSTTDGTIYEGDVASGDVTVFSEGGADGRSTAIGMKVDNRGYLWVSGGGTGQMFVYDTADGSLVATYTTPDT
jgi:hypothetical protein